MISCLGSPVGASDRVGVSVVIPHFGPPQRSTRLVAQLMSQTTDIDVQIIVVDDCSPAPFPSIPGIQVIRLTRNSGFGSAVNAGVALAEHDRLLILNNDLEVQPDFVASLLAAGESWMPSVVSPQVVSSRGTVEATGRRDPTATHQIVEWLVPLARLRHHRVLQKAVGLDVAPGTDGPRVVDWVLGSVMLMPTNSFRQVGGFDEQFFMNCEEVDLQRRLREHGIRSVALDAPVVIHEGGGASDPSRRQGWLVTSRLQYAAKWGFRRRLVAGLLVATAINFSWNVVRRLLGRPVYPVAEVRRELALVRGEATLRRPA